MAATGGAGPGSLGATAGDVNGVAFSPDPIAEDDDDGEGLKGGIGASQGGYRVATAHRDGRVRVWEISARRGRATGAKGVPHLPGRISMSGAAAAAAISVGPLKSKPSFKDDSGGGQGGVGGARGTTSSVVVEGSRVVAVLEGHSGDVFSVTWAPDGEHISTGSADKTARVWRVERRVVEDEDGAGFGIEEGAGVQPLLLGEPSEARSVGGHHGPPSAESSAARGLMYASGGLGGISSRRRLHKLRTLDR